MGKLKEQWQNIIALVVILLAGFYIYVSYPHLLAAYDEKFRFDPDSHLSTRERLEKHAQNGGQQARHSLAYYLNNHSENSEDKRRAFEIYQELAEEGFAKSQNNLGVDYEQGKGTQKDLEKAEYWYLKSANQDYAMAQDNLADLYREQERYEEAMQ